MVRVGIASAIVVLLLAVFSGPALAQRAEAPKVVDVELQLLDLPLIDTVESRYRFRAFVRFHWNDPELAGATEQLYVDQDALDRLAKIWWPIPVIVNQVGQIEVTRRVLRIAPDGGVEFSGLFETTMSSAFDLRRFPFDSQTLELRLESFAWGEEQLVFRSNDDSVGIDDALKLVEWEVSDAHTRVERVVRPRQHVTKSQLVMSIEIERYAGFYVWKVILPLILIVAISWSVFWMHDETFAGRTRVSITGVLTVVAYQFVLADSLPKIPYLTLLDAITTLSFTVIAATLFENLVASRWRERDEAVALAIDRTSRWAFPASYALMVVAVFAYYHF